ncbi:hypothetical protein PC121_g22608, partial [Phytophthora cactorum]
EVETNSEALHGDSGATAVEGKLWKKDAFEMMLKHLKSKTLNKALAALTGRNMQQDWLNYMRRFRATLKASESETGLSLTKRDLERHLSVPEKLEQMCPEFQPMKALVGRRANITPSSTVDSVFLRQNYSMEDIKESAQVRLMMDFQVC